MPDRYVGVRLSPTEAQAAVSRFDPQNRTFDIWTVNLRSGIPSRATFDPAYELLPVWSPNGETIAFGQVTGAVNKKLINGSTQAERITKLTGGAPSSWSMDGKYIAYTTTPVTGGDIGLLPMSDDGKPEIFLHEAFDHTDPQISPNSKWMAYSANGSGRPEIYVVSFPKPEGKWQISINGGVKPRWRRDGKELFFMSLSGQLMAIDLNGDGTILQKGVPKSLFDAPGPRLQAWDYNYDVTQNGQRFLFNKVMESSEAPTITVISNWQGLLQ
jgi:Tol biopolymer transport system component